MGILSYRLNRKKFFFGLLALGGLAQMSTAFDMQSGDGLYVFAGCLLILSFLLIKLRCNHIGTTPGNCIGLFIASMIPLVCLISLGYLLFKKGRDGDEGQMC